MNQTANEQGISCSSAVFQKKKEEVSTQENARQPCFTVVEETGPLQKN
jgi:hypothetical protein